MKTKSKLTEEEKKTKAAFDEMEDDWKRQKEQDKIDDKEYKESLKTAFNYKKATD